MRIRTLHIAVAALALGATISSSVQSAPRPPPGVCGDTSGPNNKDLRCSCGNRVTTNTVLTKQDPVRRGCSANGLVVADGVLLNLNGIDIAGSDAGVGITAGAGSTVIGGAVLGFRTGVAVPSGHATLTGVLIHGNADAGLVVGTPQGAAAEATVGGTGAGMSDNDGSGIVVNPSAVLTITGTAETSRLPVLRNGGVGIDVQGELHARIVEVGFSGDEGLRVHTTAPVEILGCNVHDSGNHPNGALPGKAGILALQTHPVAGLVVAGFFDQPQQISAIGLVHDNSGHGIALGDASEQTGPVYGFVGNQQIYGNDEGIHVAQLDPVAQPTASTILSNNIFNNRGAGVHLGPSAQRYIGDADQQAFSANDVHHNAVEGTSCSPAEATQTSSQIVVDGPITGTDPSVTNQPGCLGDTSGVAPCVPCGADPDSNCMGPNSNMTGDFVCYWGASNDGTATTSNDSQAECNAMNNPNGAESGGVNNHCLWNGTQCRLAWDMGGREGVESCDSSRNRIFGYVNDQNQDPSTQKGLAAHFGAYVKARRNVWGTGGSINGIFESAASDSRIDPNDDCGSISTCP